MERHNKTRKQLDKNSVKTNPFTLKTLFLRFE
jgi:hypothetical protein